MEFGEVVKNENEYMIPLKESRKLVFKGVKCHKKEGYIEVYSDEGDDVHSLISKINETMPLAMKGNKKKWFPFEVSDEFIDECYDGIIIDEKVIKFKVSEKVSAYNSNKQRISIKDIDFERELTIVVYLKGLKVERKSWTTIMEVRQYIQEMDVEEDDYLVSDEEVEENKESEVAKESSKFF